MVHLELRISSRIFEKHWNGAKGIIRGSESDDPWNISWSRKSRDTLPLILVLLLVLRAQQFPHAWRLLPRKVNLFYCFLLLSFRKKKVPFFYLCKETKCQDFVGKGKTKAFFRLYTFLVHLSKCPRFCRLMTNKGTHIHTFMVQPIFIAIHKTSLLHI